MDWFKKHADLVTVLSVLFGGFVWMNAQFGHLERSIALVEKDVAIIKTILVMKNIMPVEMSCIPKDK